MTDKQAAYEGAWGPRRSMAVAVFIAIALADITMALALGPGAEISPAMQLLPLGIGLTSVLPWGGSEWAVPLFLGSIVPAALAMTFEITHRRAHGAGWKGSVKGAGAILLVVAFGALAAYVLFSGADLLSASILNPVVAPWFPVLSGFLLLGAGIVALRALGACFGAAHEPGFCFRRTQRHLKRAGLLVACSLPFVLVCWGEGWVSWGAPWLGREVRWREVGGAEGAAHIPIWAFQRFGIGYPSTQIVVKYPSGCAESILVDRLDHDFAITSDIPPSIGPGILQELRVSNSRGLWVIVLGEHSMQQPTPLEARHVDWLDPGSWPCWCPESVGIPPSGRHHLDDLRRMPMLPGEDYLGIRSLPGLAHGPDDWGERVIIRLSPPVSHIGQELETACELRIKDRDSWMDRLPWMDMDRGPVQDSPVVGAVSDCSSVLFTFANGEVERANLVWGLDPDHPNAPPEGAELVLVRSETRGNGARREGRSLWLTMRDPAKSGATTRTAWNFRAVHEASARRPDAALLGPNALAVLQEFVERGGGLDVGRCDPERMQVPGPRITRKAKKRMP